MTVVSPWFVTAKLLHALRAANVRTEESRISRVDAERERRRVRASEQRAH